MPENINPSSPPSDEELIYMCAVVARAFLNPGMSFLYSVHLLFLITVLDTLTGWNMTLYSKMAKGANNIDGSDHVPESIPQDEKEKLEESFDPIFVGHKDIPSVITDMHGRIVAWFLPNIIHPARVVCLIHFTLSQIIKTISRLLSTMQLHI